MWHKGFWRDDSGQDIVEYTLLLAMVCLASAGLILGSGDAMSGMWGVASNNLSSANAVAGS
jgi:Flp pilus assembly pilin Flp